MSSTPSSLIKSITRIEKLLWSKLKLSFKLIKTSKRSWKLLEKKDVRRGVLTINDLYQKDLLKIKEVNKKQVVRKLK